MAPTASQRDRLDEVLAELERARQEPEWLPETTTSPRRLLRAPESLESARWVPSRTAVIAMVLVAGCAMAVFGIRVLLTRADSSSSTSTPSVAASARVSSGPSIATASASPRSAGASTAPTTLRVHVVGAVSRPGVVTLPTGSRVFDAVSAAGGLTKVADASSVNLARVVSDGEQIYITKPGEKHAGPSDPASSAGAGQGANSPGSTASAGSTSGGGKTSSDQGGGSVNLNTADVGALDGLPGVGPVLAQRIVDWRTEHGRFSSVDELNEVDGIGDKAMERLRPKVTV